MHVSLSLSTHWETQEIPINHFIKGILKMENTVLRWRTPYIECPYIFLEWEIVNYSSVSIDLRLHSRRFLEWFIIVLCNTEDMQWRSREPDGSSSLMSWMSSSLVPRVSPVFSAGPAAILESRLLSSQEFSLGSWVFWDSFRERKSLRCSRSCVAEPVTRPMKGMMAMDHP
jgi:hypothetical protein